MGRRFSERSFKRMRYEDIDGYLKKDLAGFDKTAGKYRLYK